MSTRTPEGLPGRCPICGKSLVIEWSHPTGDVPCPHCGCLLWLTDSPEREEIYGFHRFLMSAPSLSAKEEAIADIIERLVESGALAREDSAAVLAAILKHEEQGSTAIGCGVAIPNGKYPGLETMIGAIARFPAGVNFNALDGQPVGLVCLVISPADRPGDHYRLLVSLAQWLRQSNQAGKQQLRIDA